MRCKYFFILVIVFSFFFIPKVYAAENLTGAWTMYHKTTFHSVLPSGYDTTSSGVSFPSSSYTQIAAANLTDGAYSVVTQMQLQPSYTFIRGNDYTMNYHFDFGSYIYPYWPTSSNNSWFFQSCPGSNCNLSYVWQGDSSHQQTSSLDLTISFRATSDSNSATFTLGNITDDKGTFYNAYTSQQGIRISSANITEVSNLIDLDPIIDNQNQNTQDIINNNNQNTTNIINNQIENTEKEIESQKVCKTFIVNDTYIIDNTRGCLLNSSGATACGYAQNSMGITDFIEYNSLELLNRWDSSLVYTCFYDENKTLISCVSNYSMSVGTISVNGAKYFRSTMNPNSHVPVFKVYQCQNGNQALNDSLTDPNVSIGGTLLGDVDWYENSHFSSIITSPINFLNSLNQQCTPVVLPLFGKNISLPCGTTIFWDLNNNYVQEFRAFWNVLFGGLIIYRLALTLIMHINDALDPTKDKIGGLEV